MLAVWSSDTLPRGERDNVFTVARYVITES